MYIDSIGLPKPYLIGNEQTSLGGIEKFENGLKLVGVKNLFGWFPYCRKC